MVERLVAFARGLDEDRKVGARLRLADEFRQQLRAQRGVAAVFCAALGRDDAGGRGHAARLTGDWWFPLAPPLRGRDERSSLLGGCGERPAPDRQWPPPARCPSIP